MGGNGRQWAAMGGNGRQGAALDHRSRPSHTCDPVSMLLRGEAVCVFQNRMHLSAVPPPEANNPF
jgi:hypothetical protein